MDTTHAFWGPRSKPLVALDALMTERKLTAAARRVKLSPTGHERGYRAPAHLLLATSCFRCRPRTYPDTRAEALAPAVRDALLHIQLSVIAGIRSTSPVGIAVSGSFLSDFHDNSYSLRGLVERLAREALRQLRVAASRPTIPMSFSGAVMSIF